MNPRYTWQQNAEGCNSPVPFHAIIAETNPLNNPKVLVAGEFDRGTAALLCSLSAGRRTQC
jgi:hypothetical protein